MSIKSNDNGRALEFAYLLNLHSEISKQRAVKILKNSSYEAAKKAWEKLSLNEQNLYNQSSLTGIKILFQAEPLILEHDEDELEILMQKDNAAKMGDVRDILIIRNTIKYEIGLLPAT